MGYSTGSGSSDCCSFCDEGSCVASCDSNSFSNSSFDCVCDQFYQEPARLYRLVRFDSVEEPNYLYIIDEVKLTCSNYEGVLDLPYIYMYM